MADAPRVIKHVNKGYKFADGGFIGGFTQGFNSGYGDGGKRPRNPAQRQMQGATSQQAGSMPDQSSQYNRPSQGAASQQAGSMNDDYDDAQAGTYAPNSPGRMGSNR
jgi:hypothetical protein